MENVLERPSQSQALTAQRPERKPFPVLRVLAWLFLALLSLLFIVPFLWMVSTSLKPPSDLMLLGSEMPRMAAWPVCNPVMSAQRLGAQTVVPA